MMRSSRSSQEKTIWQFNSIFPVGQMLGRNLGRLRLRSSSGRPNSVIPRDGQGDRVTLCIIVHDTFSPFDGTKEYKEGTTLIYTNFSIPQYSARTECGYATVKDVRDHTLEDRMESFFLAETTKYVRTYGAVVKSPCACVIYTQEGHNI